MRQNHIRDIEIKEAENARAIEELKAQLESLHAQSDKQEMDYDV